MQVDDTDPSILYLPVNQWVSDTLQDAVGQSRHKTASVGSTVSYKFHGTGIEVFGTIGKDSGQPTTQYTIDGQHPKVYTVPPSAATLDSQRQFNISFYSQRGLHPGEHTLTIINLNGTSPNIFWLDYFTVDTPKSSESTTTVPSTTSNLSMSASSNETSKPLPTNTTAIPLPPSSASSSEAGISPVLSSAISSTLAPTTKTAIYSPTPPTEDPSPATASPDATVTISDLSSSTPNVSAQGALSQGEHHTSTAAIVGGIMGVLLVIAVVVIFALIRKRRQAKERVIFPDDPWYGNAVTSWEQEPKLRTSETSSELPYATTAYLSHSVVPDLPPTPHVPPNYSSPFR